MLLFIVSALSARSAQVQDTTIDGTLYECMYTDSFGGSWVEHYNNSHLQGKYLEYYGNGELKARGQFRNGKKVGHWMTFYRNGHNESDGIYDKKFEQVGKWYYFFPDGTTRVQVQYRVRFCLFWGGGANFLSALTHFRRTVPTGDLIEYYPGGDIRCKLYYDKKGYLDGHAYYYFGNENLQRDEAYMNGNPITIKEFCPNGVLDELTDFFDEENNYSSPEGCNCDDYHQVYLGFEVSYGHWPVSRYRIKF
jgi:antitoxin component YwqK of YwqJK toxin-antitoxin module